ncbi:MAG: CBS domain-containing protein [Candidatus Aenigmarchaeota archaeon]|nr:CBS domain-containing protein [Candidatus Aenigmarchaeota archaeon]
MMVKDVMNTNVVVAKLEATIREASEVMDKYNIGSLVVIGEKGIAGIITEHNILETVAANKNPDETKVGDVMSPEVVTVSPDSTIEQAVDLMVEHKIKKLPVVEGDKLLGIITASDIIVVEPKLVASIANLISMKMPAYSGG